MGWLRVAWYFVMDMATTAEKVLSLITWILRSRLLMITRPWGLSAPRSSALSSLSKDSRPRGSRQVMPVRAGWIKKNSVRFRRAGTRKHAAKRCVLRSSCKPLAYLVISEGQSHKPRFSIDFTQKNKFLSKNFLINFKVIRWMHRYIS
jgi:hypothetical protein